MARWVRRRDQAGRVLAVANQKEGVLDRYRVTREEADRAVDGVAGRRGPPAARAVAEGAGGRARGGRGQLVGLPPRRRPAQQPGCALASAPAVRRRDLYRRRGVVDAAAAARRGDLLLGPGGDDPGFADARPSAALSALPVFPVLHHAWRGSGGRSAAGLLPRAASADG